LSALLRLRPATAADLAFITGLERRADHIDAIGQWRDEEHLAAIHGHDHRSHAIIEREGRPLGYLVSYDRRRETRGFYVKRLLVADKDRGTGSAALALFNAEAFAREDCELVWLHVRTANARAQNVYRKLGFERHDAPDGALFDRAGEALTPNAMRMVLRRTRALNAPR
jgi:ribosomal protein S18 acetylase RimI-like enzyme